MYRRLAACLLMLTVIRAGAASLDDLVNTPCEPRPDRPPVVLIHGTFASTQRAFSTLAPALKADGYCLYAMNYGKQGLFSPNGTGDIRQSADTLGRFVQDVLARTGATKVNLVGHSQGGLLAMLLARRADLAAQVARVVAVAPSLRGTDRVRSQDSVPLCMACTQQASDSDFIKDANAEPWLTSGVKAMILATRNDLVVTPVDAQFVIAPGIRNVLLQDRYPGLKATHSGLMHVPEAVSLMREFLEEAP